MKAATPTPVEVGTAAGAAAGTAITINLDLATSGISAGTWTLEAVAARTGTNPKTLIPNVTTGFPYEILIVDIQQY